MSLQIRSLGPSRRGLGGTVAIFTPTDFLVPNSVYTVRLTGAADLAGNPLAGGTLESPFFTVDTIGPLIQFLQSIGQPLPGTIVQVVPTIADPDLARVEYEISGQPAQIAMAPPYAANVTMPASGTVQVRAVAVDTFNNRSTIEQIEIDVLSNQPPQVTLSNPGGS